MANTFAGKIAEAQNRTSSLSGYAIPLSDEAVKQSEEDRKNAIIRSGATVLDVVTNVLQGVTSSLEGIYDFGQGIVGAVGGIVDKDFQDRVQKSIEYDFTSDLFGKDGAGNGKFDTTWGSDLAEQSYLKEDGIVNGIAQGFGGMLPSIAITLATGGAGAGSLVSTVGKIGASVAFGGGAAGKSMEQALKQGANYGQALGYGAVSGAIELGTEALGGVAVGGSTELANSVIGKWLIKTGADKAVRKGIGKVAYTFASEGVEEVLSDILDPINQKAWGIENDIDWGEVVSGLPKTFLVGGGLGVVMEGMGSSISALKNSDKGGTKYNSIVTDLTTIQDLTAADEAVKASSATQDKVNSVETKVNERILESVKSISETAKSMTEEQRAALFAEAPILENFIGKDGEINADLEASLTAQKESGVSANSSKAGFNTEAEKKRLAEWFGGEEVTLDTDAISETERDAMRQVVSAQKGINAKTGSNVRVVLVKTNDAAKKSFVNIRVGDTIYMTRENLSNGKWAAKLIHENEHLIEGVNEELAEALMSDESTLDEAKKSVISNYGVTSEEMDSAIKKAKTGLSMTERENLAYSELVAKLSEQMGTKESIARIARDNSTLAKKILNGIKDSISTLTASKADRATLASLRAKERLFEKALEKQNVASQVKLYNDDTKEEQKTEEREKVKRDLERAIAFNAETENEDSEIRESREYDAEYLELAKEPEKNKTALEKMVRDRAKDSGYGVEGFHGTDEKFTQFRSNYGVYVTTSRAVAESYGKNVMHVFGSNVGQLAIDAGGSRFDAIPVSDRILNAVASRNLVNNDGTVTTEFIAQAAKALGYRTVKISNVLDESGYEGAGSVVATDYIFLDEYGTKNGLTSQVKSADLVTYDDNGDIIPLSERFNGRNYDIRYSMENPDEKVATRGEVAELQAKNSGDKFFTYENAKKAVRTFEGSIDGYVLPKRTFTQLSNMVHESLNLKTSGARLSRFKEIASLAIDMAKNQDGEAYGDSLTLPERNKAVSDIVDSLKSFYEEKGTKSDKVKADEKIKSVVDTADRRVDIIKEREKAKTEEAKRKVSEVEEQLKRLSSPYKSASLIHSISQTADELHAFTDRKYAQTHGIPVSVNLFKDGQFKSLAVAAQKVFTGKMLSPRKVREAVCNLSRYLNTETNEIFREFVDGLNVGNAELLQADFDLIDDSYDEKTQTYSTDPLSLQELQAVDNIFKTIKKMYTDYDSIVLDGKRVSLTESAKEYQAKMVESIEARAPLSDSAFKAFLGKLDALGDFYVDTFATPSVVANRLDGYRDGFFTEEMKKLQAAQWQATDINYELSKPAQEFIKKNKRYSKRLTNERIKVFGKNLLVGEAIDLYLQVTQDNGALTIFHENGGGFVFTGENGKVESKATRVGGNKYETVKTAVKLFQEEMDSLFTEQDKEFISIIKGIYKETGVYKKKRDISRLGYSNVVGGEYYTITRDKSRIKSNVGDARTQYDDLQAVNNLAINKRRSEKAKAIPLLLTNVYDKMLNVCRQTSVYYAFSEEISNFNRLYNKNIGEEAKGEFFTIRGYAHDIWDGTEKYFRKLLNDMQGVSTKSKGTLEKLLGKARSAYAQSALGFNLKVIAGQPVSYFTALAMLDADCLAKGMAMKSDKKQMDKYSVTARIRNIDDVVVKAESITDKVGDVGKALTKPINWSDRFTIGQLWNACQLQVAKSKGFSIGSEENLKAAGELLDEVNSATQPTYQATDRSAFQRSDNEIIKSFAMFTSVAVKQLSLFVGSIGKVNAYKQYVKFYGKRLAEMKANGMSGEKFAEAMKMSSDAKAELKAAKKQMAKSLTAILITNAMYAIMCQAVKFLYDKDDEEDNDGKNIAEQATEQFVNSSVSMFPIGKEIYNLIQGYDLEAMPLSTLNDVASSIIDMFGTGKDIIEGNADRTDVAKALRDQIFSISALVGLPTRNIYNTLYGLVKRVSPATAYNINSIFYAAKGDDIKTAKTDSEASAAAAVAMLDRGFDIGKEQADILAKLYRSGYSLPSSAPDYITVDEEKVTLTKKQKQTFEIEYSKAATEADAIIGKIVGESEEVQAKTLSIIYKYYKDSATYECGFDSTKLYMFGQAVGIGDLSFMIAKVAELTANKSNRKEIITRYVSSASLTAVQKKMVMGYFGYKNESGEGAVKAYIAKLDLTTDEKKKLLGYCGY